VEEEDRFRSLPQRPNESMESGRDRDVPMRHWWTGVLAFLGALLPLGCAIPRGPSGVNLTWLFVQMIGGAPVSGAIGYVIDDHLWARRRRWED
jgi:hypothetical protein